MKLWKAEYTGRWGEKFAINVSAKTFADAVQTVKQVARKRKDGRPTLTSLALTANLDN